MTLGSTGTSKAGEDLTSPRLSVTSVSPSPSVTNTAPRQVG